MTGSVLKWPDFCCCKPGDGVFIFGNGRIVLFKESELCANSVELLGILLLLFVFIVIIIFCYCFYYYY